MGNGPGLPQLPRMQVAPNAANLATLALHTLQTRMGLTAQQLRHRLIMFASDGAAVLHGRLPSGIQRVREQVAPFAQPMHCMAHRVDLSASSLDGHRIMEDTKALLDGVFGYYSHSTARREALIAVQQSFGVREHRIIRPAPTRWTSHYSALDHALEQLVGLVVHAVEERCMRAKLQRLFTLQNFPFVNAFDVWTASGRYGAAIEWF